jgi:hypothetical protein
MHKSTFTSDFSFCMYYVQTSTCLFRPTNLYISPEHHYILHTDKDSSFWVLKPTASNFHA